ncbi:3-aminobutyryl-CoA ammonia lyase [compost metagenome]
MAEFESMIRLRLGEHDAHYAGGLVAGAKMMELFGDVATELLIRCDGDEGLFVAYSNVEFLKPVYAGDYVEARGRITKIGNTSRTMEFEVHKVIRPLKGPEYAVSAAEVLAEPELICRASGTCVTPKEMQRLKRV